MSLGIETVPAYWTACSHSQIRPGANSKSRGMLVSEAIGGMVAVTARPHDVTIEWAPPLERFNRVFTAQGSSTGTMYAARRNRLEAQRSRSFR